MLLLCLHVSEKVSAIGFICLAAITEAFETLLFSSSLKRSLRCPLLLPLFCSGPLPIRFCSWYRAPEICPFVCICEEVCCVFFKLTFFYFSYHLYFLIIFWCPFSYVLFSDFVSPALQDKVSCIYRLCSVTFRFFFLFMRFTSYFF